MEKETAQVQKDIAELESNHEAFVATENAKIGFHYTDTQRKITEAQDDLVACNA